jgi:hypothetical protein
MLQTGALYRRDSTAFVVSSGKGEMQLVSFFSTSRNILSISLKVWFSSGDTWKSRLPKQKDINNRTKRIKSCYSLWLNHIKNEAYEGYGCTSLICSPCSSYLMNISSRILRHVKINYLKRLKKKVKPALWLLTQMYIQWLLSWTRSYWITIKFHLANKQGKRIGCCCNKQGKKKIYLENSITHLSKKKALLNCNPELQNYVYAFIFWMTTLVYNLSIHMLMVNINSSDPASASKIIKLLWKKNASMDASCISSHYICSQLLFYLHLRCVKSYRAMPSNLWLNEIPWCAD